MAGSLPDVDQQRFPVHSLEVVFIVAVVVDGVVAVVVAVVVVVDIEVDIEVVLCSADMVALRPPDGCERFLQSLLTLLN